MPVRSPLSEIAFEMDNFKRTPPARGKTRFFRVLERERSLPRPPERFSKRNRFKSRMLKKLGMQVTSDNAFIRSVGRDTPPDIERIKIFHFFILFISVDQ